MRRKLTDYWLRVLTSRAGINYLYLPSADKSDGRTISVVIPHFNRSDLIYCPLRNIIHDHRVSEIIIYDDGSRASEFEAMRSKASRVSSKIKIVRHEDNRGAFRAKLEGVRLAKNEWVVLLDSDNFLFGHYLNAVFRAGPWSPDTIYCADFAWPDYAFTRWGGESFDMEGIRELCRQKEFHILMLLNDGNYFVNREQYVSTAEPFKEIDVAAADVLAFNYLWLNRGSKLRVLDGVRYFHRVHEMSYFLKTEKKSTGIVEGIYDSIISGRTHRFR